MKILATLVVLAAATDPFRAPKGFDDNGYKINGQHPQRRLQA